MFNVGDIVTTESRIYIWRVTDTSLENVNGVELLTIGEYDVMWPEERHFSIGWDDGEGLIPFSTEPEADAIAQAANEASRNAIVYMAYTRSRNTNTITIISHIDENRFNTMLRLHELQGFETLAKKRIKFTL